jgi:hypothetical protein
MSSSEPLTMPDQEKTLPESERVATSRDRPSMSPHSEDSTKESISLPSTPEISLSRTPRTLLRSWPTRLSRLLPTIQTVLLSKRRTILRRVPRSTDDLKIILRFYLEFIFFSF